MPRCLEEMRPDRVRAAGFILANRWRVAAVLWLAFLGMPAGMSPATQTAAQPSRSVTYDSSSFIQELARLKTELGNAGGSADTLRAYREALPKTWTVDTAGRRFDVPTDVFVSRLTKAEKQPELRRQQVGQAREYLDALSAEAASLSVPPSAAADSSKPKLDAILSRPEYTHERKESWFDRLRDRISDILSEALDRLFGKVGGQKSLGYILLWTGVAGAAVLIAYWVFRNWFRMARVAEMALGAVSVPSRSWQQWMFASREAAARGDYRMAIHCAYWAGITRLQDLGALSPDRTRTPREYLRALTESRLVFAENPVMRREALAQMTSRLEQTWYGYRQATEADFRDSLAQLEILGCRLR
jgi:hypothetical protein